MGSCPDTDIDPKELVYSFSLKLSWSDHTSMRLFSDKWYKYSILKPLRPFSCCLWWLEHPRLPPFPPLLVHNFLGSPESLLVQSNLDHLNSWELGLITSPDNPESGQSNIWIWMFIDYGTREASPDNWKIWMIEVQIIEVWLHPFKFLGTAFNSIGLGKSGVFCTGTQHNNKTKSQI